MSANKNRVNKYLQKQDTDSSTIANPVDFFFGNNATNLAPEEKSFLNDKLQNTDTTIISLQIDHIRDFPKHPFKVINNDAMLELIDSIRDNGVITPCLVREVGDGFYEMLSGHRRKFASSQLGLIEIPCIILDIDDATATMMMVDANIQRPKISIMETAQSIKMKFEAIKHQGKATAQLEPKIFKLASSSTAQVEPNLDTTDTTAQLEPKQLNNSSVQVEPKIESIQSELKHLSIEVIADAFDCSPAKAKRYIRLNELIKPFQDMVDNEDFSVMTGYNLSFVSHTNQYALYNYMQQKTNIKLTMDNTEQLKIQSVKDKEQNNQDCDWTNTYFLHVFFPQTEHPKKQKDLPTKFSISYKDVKQYVPEDDISQLNHIVPQALQLWYSLSDNDRVDLMTKYLDDDIQKKE